MIIRSIRLDDYEKVRIIHEKYYANEFSLPNFMTNFVGAFVLEDNDGIIAVCSLRKIAEVIAITNKDRSVRERTSALLSGSEAITFIAGKEGFNQIHAFVQDEKWEKLLIKVGWKQTKGNSLVLEI